MAQSTQFIRKWRPAGLFFGLLMACSIMSSTATANPMGYRMAQMPQPKPVERTFEKTDVYRWALKHPVNYWWENTPSHYGNWDYFTPVDHPFEAIPLLIKQPAYVETTGQEKKGFSFLDIF